MTRLAEPHAGVLVDRHVDPDRAAELRDRASRLPQIAMSARETAELDLVSSGAVSPLSGFMGARDYRSTLERLRLADGTPFPVPLTLAVTVREVASVLRHGAAALRDPAGRLRGVLDAPEAFVRNVRDEALALFGTADATHRVVARVLSRPSGTLGGRVQVLPPSGEDAGPLTPRDVRALARRHRWARLEGVATRDAIGCVAPVGAPRAALLPVLPVPAALPPGRDAFLQAIVLKNYGALDVYLEHDRADWLAASPDLLPEDLGVRPVWVLAARRPNAAASGALDAA